MRSLWERMWRKLEEGPRLSAEEGHIKRLGREDKPIKESDMF
jgi:hypothetical protein